MRCARRHHQRALLQTGTTGIGALRIIYTERGKHFDEDLAEQFIRHVGIYPTGSIVELKTGEVGIVITNPRNRHLPKVLLVLDSDKQAMDECVVNLEKLAKLSKEPGDEQPIAKALTNGSHGIRIEEYVMRGLNV